MHRSLRLGLTTLAAAGVLAGCGNDDSEQKAAAKPASGPQSYEEAKTKVDVKEIPKGEVTIRNKWGNRVQCDVPGYRGGAKFGIDESSAKIVRADEVEGKKVVDVTCGDQRVSALNVTPDTEGADLEYVNEITFRQVGFNYLHSHLDFRNMGCEGQDPRTFDWAASRTGSCIGLFLAGSPPFVDESEGITRWERLGGSSPKQIPSSVRGLAGPNESLIKITQERRDIHGARIECYVIDRTRGECYTDFREQDGKPAGSQGGPMQITVENGATRDHRFSFIRGFCRKSDPMCTPH